MELQASVFDSEQNLHAYPDGIQGHYWHVARNRILTRVIASTSREVAPTEVILEIGCGRGIVVSHLRSAGLPAYGCDLTDAVPITELVGDFLYLRSNAFDLPESFRKRVGRIALLDVLEHIEQPASFLRETALHFPNCRQWIVTLPARQELWSNYDKWYGHFQRYDLEGVRRLADDASVRVEDLRYFFHALYFPALAVTRIHHKRSLTLRPPGPGAAWLHKVLGFLFSQEQWLFPSRLPGMSILARFSRQCSTDT